MVVLAVATPVVLIWGRVQRTRVETLRAGITRDAYSNPVPASLLQGMTMDQMAAFFMQRQQAEMQMAPFKQLPAGLDALNMSNGSSVKPDAPAAPLLPAPAAMSLLPGERVLEALKRQGVICRSNNSVHIGNSVEDGTPQYMELRDWGALALGGKARTGKTTRARYIIAQLVMMGCKLVVCDKHAHKLDTQGAAFLLPTGMGRLAEGLSKGEAVYVDDSGTAMIVDCPLKGGDEDEIEWAAENIRTWRPARPQRTKVALSVDDELLLQRQLESPLGSAGTTGTTGTGSGETGQNEGNSQGGGSDGSAGSRGSEALESQIELELARDIIKLKLTQQPHTPDRFFRALLKGRDEQIISLVNGVKAELGID
jgi:hypothetical protein